MTATTRSSILLIGLNALSLCAFGQGKSRYRVFEGWAISEQARPLRSYESAERELAGGVYDVRADTLLEAADAFTRHIFHVGDLGREKAVTVSNTGGDVLIVKWGIEQPLIVEDMVLRDTAYVSEYTFRLKPRKINSRDDLTTLLSDILVCGQPPLNARPELIEVALPAEPPGIHAFSGSISRSSSPLLTQLAVAGFETGQDWFLTLRLGKDLTEGFYPVPPFVPERFPPLVELAKSWSFDRVWSEIGTPADEPEVRLDYSERRDLILVRELVRRGLSPEQLTELLVSTKRVNLYSHTVTVLAALQNSGKETLLADILEPALRRYAPIGNRAAESVRVLFNGLAEHCSTQVETVALRTVREGLFVDGPLSYLDRCGNSEEALRTIRALDVPEGLSFRKEHAMKTIQERIRKDHK